MQKIPNLLVVDDNATNVLFVSALLKGINVNIIKASSGYEALELTKGVDLALSLLDVQMPGMDGYELARRLNREREGHSPIIFITASYPSNDQILKGYEAGAVDYITKPFQGQILISKVNVFLELYLQKHKIKEIANELSQMTVSLSQANASLTISEEEYRTLLNASPDGIVLINVSGKITDISKSVLKLYGTNNRQDIIGKHYQRFVPPGQVGKIRNIQNLLENVGLAQNIEFTLNRKDQSYYPSEISAALIERQHGSFLSYLILVRDVSQRKSMESQLLHSDRLASLGEMASAMAHEINQPLNTLSLVFDNMMLEATKKDFLDKEYFERKSTKVFESIRRIRDTIDHVRVFSRSHANHVQTSFDVNKSIINAVSLMNEQLKQNGITLHFKPTEHLPWLLGNTFELEQVFINLLSNARDAILEKQNHVKEEFQMSIDIHTYQIGQNIYIEVEDNGMGIKPEHIDQIMLPFYSTKEAGKGTGLGLSITYGIIKNMHGDITIQSEVLKGTTLKIMLPIHKD